eukprot:2842301-Amphidinium_carterae.1
MDILEVFSCNIQRLNHRRLKMPKTGFNVKVAPPTTKRRHAEEQSNHNSNRPAYVLWHEAAPLRQAQLCGRFATSFISGDKSLSKTDPGGDVVFVRPAS